MALAQRMNTFGSHHPGLNFASGLAAGIALTIAATFGALTLQSQTRVESAVFAPTTVDQEWAAPRITVAGTGSITRTPEDHAFPPARNGGGQTFNAIRAQTEEAALFAPRVTVGQRLTGVAGTSAIPLTPEVTAGMTDIVSGHSDTVVTQ